MLSTTDTGKRAEEVAASYLGSQGLRLLQQNYRCPGGEIDLVMQDDNQLVFVEVRYRKHSAFGSAIESIDRTKQGRLVHAAEYYLQQTGRDQACRFDVVGIDGAGRIDWIPDAFQA